MLGVPGCQVSRLLTGNVTVSGLDNPSELSAFIYLPSREKGVFSHIYPVYPPNSPRLASCWRWPSSEILNLLSNKDTLFLLDLSRGNVCLCWMVSLLSNYVKGFSDPFVAGSLNYSLNSFQGIGL